MQGDHARNVEASEVQGYISDSNTVCSDTDTSLGYSCLLGIWRHASQSLKCLFSSPKNSLQRHGCHFNAHPPGMPMKIPLLDPFIYITNVHF